jgi:hypothetical protein
MQKYINTVQDRTGKAISGASVLVTLASDGSTASLYSADGANPTANPTATDVNGQFSFYAADGRYNIAVTANGYTVYLTDILLEDPEDGSDAVFTDIIVSGKINQKVPNILQIVAGKGGVADGFGGGAGDSNYTQDSARTICRIGPGGAYGLRIVYGNFYRAPAETDGANDITVRAAIEVRNASGTFYTYPVTFNGSETVVISPRAGLVISDPIGTIFEANTVFFVRSEVTVASGDRFPVGSLVHSSTNWSGGTSLGGENYVRSLGPSVVYDTGSIAGSATQGYAPYAIIGAPLMPMPSVLLIGDSICNGTGDSVSQNIIAGGYAGHARGLTTNINEPGVIIPYCRLSKGGDSLNTYRLDVNLADNARTLTAAQWATHAIVNLGNNDIVGSNLATMQSKYI